jgi:asparagine synthase (glutamine-hydrolysing)
MCGFAGFLGSSPGETYSTRDLNRIANGMSQRISHRGPDDSGVWTDERSQIALSFRRLSILDLTAAGHQPMCSPNDQYVIVFNGEIYNHKDILRELQAKDRNLKLRGHSDTEVLAAGFEQWGVAQTLRRCVGMFAVAAWDKRSRRLFLGRDRFGEKPLYYGTSRGTLLFGSELDAIESHPAFDCDIDRVSLACYMQSGYVPAPRSIYREIRKLEPGTVVSFTNEHLQQHREGDCESYWSVEHAAAQARLLAFEGSDADARNELEGLLQRTIREQMVADVPVGAFLSGGVDSSLIVAMMQAQSTRRVKTFSIGFHEKAFDEAPFARAIADYLGTDHTELYLSGKDALDVIPYLSEVYDEPFADSSQIPTMLVSKLARSSVTVSLSGDGGDEIFCGYLRYQLMQKMWGLVSKFPSVLRRPLGNAIGSFPLLRRAPQGSRRHRIKRACEVFSMPTFEQSYRALCDSWTNSLVVGFPDTDEQYRNNEKLGCHGRLKQMMLSDMMEYLPDDILVKVDRATMYFGLESRSPLLDHRLMEFAMRLPDRMLLRGNESKWLLRQCLYQLVPRQLIERPKMGFSVPLNDWLRGPLRAWANDLLDQRKLKSDGYIDAGAVEKAWIEHNLHGCSRGTQLWNVLMFQAWLERSTNRSKIARRAA